MHKGTAILTSHFINTPTLTLFLQVDFGGAIKLQHPVTFLSSQRVINMQSVEFLVVILANMRVAALSQDHMQGMHFKKSFSDLFIFCV